MELKVSAVVFGSVLGTTAFDFVGVQVSVHHSKAQSPQSVVAIR